MNKTIGLWIDHRKAVIVMILGETQEITQMVSNMEKHVRYSSSSQESPGEDQRDRQFAEHLGKYYDEAITHVRDADSILILGPGEAKGEFVKRLQGEGLGDRVAGVETVDKMTDPQIVARVRQHFLEQS